MLQIKLAMAPLNLLTGAQRRRLETPCKETSTNLTLCTTLRVTVFGSLTRRPVVSNVAVGPGKQGTGRLAKKEDRLGGKVLSVPWLSD